MYLKYLKHLAKQGASFIHPGGYAATQLLIEKLEIQPDDKILEIGCGTGATLVEIASKYNIQLYGVDILDEMLITAGERTKQSGLEHKINLQKAEVNKPLPFEKGTFDKIYLESVIGFQGIGTFKVMLAEIHRLLKKGGLYIACEALWKENVPEETVKKIYESSEKDFGLAQASVSNITLSKFIALANETGFVKTEVLSLDNLKNIEQAETFSEMKKKIVSPAALFKEIYYRFKLKKHISDGVHVSNYITIMRKV